MVPGGFGEVSRVEMNGEVMINDAPGIGGIGGTAKGGTNAMQCNAIAEMGRRKLVAIGF